MLKALRRMWRYLTAKTNQSFNERADPKVQLEQTMTEAAQQHRRLVEQAAAVVGNQKRTELQLNRAMEELEKLNGNTRQAIVMADEATRRGDADQATKYTLAAESFANRLIQLEAEIEDLKSTHLQATQAADQAKHAAQQSSTTLQKKVAERQRLLSQLDQAKLAEQINKTMASLAETVGEDVPTFDEVRDKIEARYAKAKGMAEINSMSVDSSMLEVEAAARNTEAQGRLAEIRAQLGLGPGTADAAAPQVEQPQAQPQPGPSGA